jgi:signal transduction histidine kinase
MDRLLARNRALARERDEQARKLEELHRAEEFRRTFVSDVTHEIKTPLTGILAAVELLPESEGDELRSLADMIRKESMRLNNLVRDVLSLAQLEHPPAETPCAFAAAELDDVMREVADRMKTKADAAGIVLRVMAAAPISCVCDARLIGQALDNLVENAIRYSGSKDIVLSLAQDGDGAVLSVEDHGTGIPPEHRARVFERFYRVDKARSREQGGTGLGLAIVKHIARLHGGEATLTDAAGGGCKFTISIPFNQQQTTNKRKESNT